MFRFTRFPEAAGSGSGKSLEHVQTLLYDRDARLPAALRAIMGLRPIVGQQIPFQKRILSRPPAWKPLDRGGMLHCGCTILAATRSILEQVTPFSGKGISSNHVFCAETYHFGAALGTGLQQASGAE
jgi:hypothetical protein